LRLSDTDRKDIRDCLYRKKRQVETDNRKYLRRLIQEVETVRLRVEGYKRLSVEEVETGRDR